MARKKKHGGEAAPVKRKKKKKKISLIAAMHALPTELRNYIQEFTFTINPGRVDINANYKPPSIIQIDRASRHELKIAYLKRTTFICCEATGGFEHLKAWLFTLSCMDCSMIRKMQIVADAYIDVPSYFTLAADPNAKYLDSYNVKTQYVKPSADRFHQLLRHAQIGAWLTNVHFTARSIPGLVELLFDGRLNCKFDQPQ